MASQIPETYDSRRLTERVAVSVRTPDSKRSMTIDPSLADEHLQDGWLLTRPAEGQRPDGTWEDES